MKNLYHVNFRNPSKDGFSSSDPNFYIIADTAIEAIQKANLAFVAFKLEKGKELAESITSAFWQDRYNVYELTSLTLTTNNLIS